MHGTADPVVPFGQSAGGLTAYRDAGYPNARLRALEGWNHRPAEHNGPIPLTSQQLAWVEGMTSTEMTRVGASFAMLSRPSEKTLHDFTGLYLLAQRITTMSDAPDRARSAATSAMQNVDALAMQHIAKMKAPAPSAQVDLSDAAWIGHLPIFLRQFLTRGNTPRRLPCREFTLGADQTRLPKNDLEALKRPNQDDLL